MYINKQYCIPAQFKAKAYNHYAACTMKATKGY